ncbi:MAG: beta-propeller fold lactonase family protein [Pseudomonadota bacterium]
MGIFNFKGTITGGMLDMPLGTARFSAAGSQVILASDAGGGAIVMSLNQGQLAHTQTAYTINANVPSVAAHWVNGSVQFSVNDINQVLQSASTSSLTIYVENSGAFTDRFEAVSFETSGKGYVALAASADSGIGIYEVTPNGSLTQTDLITGAEGGYSDSPAALSIVHVGSEQFLVSVSATDDSITSFSIEPDGSLTQLDTVGVEHFLPVATPQDVASLTVDGTSFVVMASSDTSSLTVFEISKTGNLTAVDQVVDDLSTRLNGAQVIETFTIGERGFVLAAGQDSGISLFGILPDGQLLHLETLVDETDYPIDTITDMYVADVDGTYQLFTISGSEAGVGQFSLNLNDLGITATVDSTDVSGTTADDLLTADGAGQTVLGLAGNDILKDGAGADTLAGGAGDDIFVLTADGEIDTITDFDPANDQLDLSGFTFFRSVSQLDVASTTDGATLTFGNETVHVKSADGSSLDVDDFTDGNTINATHVDTSFVFEDFQEDVPVELSDIESHFNTSSAPSSDTVLTGTAQDNHLTGDATSQVLIGGGGQDVLRGGDGADVLSGGDGFDTADYADATSGVVADLDNDTNNTGFAQGDSFDSIEALGGSAFDDILGGDAAGNALFGATGDDVLRGRDGDDRLFGGAGGDWMDGGTGNDMLSGGEGDDALLGRAGDDEIFGGAGDDNIAAHVGDDIVYGGAGDDQLGGSDGDDRMYGGSGDDTIGSGSHDDYIHAGHGNDVASGGWGMDDVNGGDGNDVLAGSYGDDIVTGGDGDDALGGGTGTDQLFAGAGNDTIGAGHDDDVAYGGAGNDFIGGGDGDDHLDGGAGDDKINSGDGDDVIFGGAGADTYVFNAFTAGEVDTIMDFDTTQDIIRMKGVDGRYSALEIATVTIEGEEFTEISYDGHTIRLADTDAASLSPDDFVFIG